MVVATQLLTGMTVLVDGTPYRVETVTKVATQKAAPFIKVKLRQLVSGESVERNFKPTQAIEEVSLEEHQLEYLYKEATHHVFLDIGSLNLIKVDDRVVGKKIHYLKEGIEAKGYGTSGMILSLDLPQFLELMVAGVGSQSGKEGSVRIATLETGAKLEVPQFVDVGDVIKVDTKLEEYIQRV
jgi:elongation factor P